MPGGRDPRFVFAPPPGRDAECATRPRFRTSRCRGIRRCDCHRIAVPAPSETRRAGPGKSDRHSPVRFAGCACRRWSGRPRRAGTRTLCSRRRRATSGKRNSRAMGIAGHDAERHGGASRSPGRDHVLNHLPVVFALFRFDIGPVKPDVNHRTREAWIAFGRARLAHPTLAGIGQQRIRLAELFADRIGSQAPAVFDRECAAKALSSRARVRQTGIRFIIGGGDF